MGSRLRLYFWRWSRMGSSYCLRFWLGLRSSFGFSFRRSFCFCLRLSLRGDFCLRSGLWLGCRLCLGLRCSLWFGFCLCLRLSLGLSLRGSLWLGFRLCLGLRLRLGLRRCLRCSFCLCLRLGLGLGLRCNRSYGQGFRVSAIGLGIGGLVGLGRCHVLHLETGGSCMLLALGNLLRRGWLVLYAA